MVVSKLAACTCLQCSRCPWSFD